MNNYKKLTHFMTFNSHNSPKTLTQWMGNQYMLFNTCEHVTTDNVFII